MIVAVYGSASPKPGDALYEQAKHLGHLLAQKGYTVMTGGYCGTMESTLEGVLQVPGAHTIGVSCDEIEAYRPGKVNQWVRQEARTQTLSERIDFLCRKADAFIAVDGGVGTLAEVMIAYNLLVIGAIPRKPLILIGEAWRSIFEQFYEKQHAHMPAFVRDLPVFVADPEEAVMALEK